MKTLNNFNIVMHKKNRGGKKQHKQGGKQHGGGQNQQYSLENELTDGITGFLITCDRNKEKQAIKESYQIIEQHIERLYPELAAQYDRLQEQYIQQQIEQKEYHSQKKIQKLEDGEKEVQHETEQQQDNKEKKEDHFNQNQEKPEKVRKRFIREAHIKMLQSFDTRVNCLVFIKLNRKTYQELDVDQLGRDIMNTVYEGRERISRCCYKFVPVRYLFKASIEECRICLKDLIEQYFPKDTPVTWMLWFKARYTNKVSKSDVLKQLNELLPPLCGNDTRDPDYVIFVEVNGVLDLLNQGDNDYKKFNEYSIRGNFKDENGEARPRPEKPAKPSVLETDDFQRQEFIEEVEVDLL